MLSGDGLTGATVIAIARCPNSKELKLSWILELEGEILIIMRILERPHNDSCRRRVSLESLHGINTLDDLQPFSMRHSYELNQKYIRH